MTKIMKQPLHDTEVVSSEEEEKEKDKLWLHVEDGDEKCEGNEEINIIRKPLRKPSESKKTKKEDSFSGVVRAGLENRNFSRYFSFGKLGSFNNNNENEASEAYLVRGRVTKWLGPYVYHHRQELKALCLLSFTIILGLSAALIWLKSTNSKLLSKILAAEDEEQEIYNMTHSSMNKHAFT